MSTERDETFDNGVPITIWAPTTIKQTARERLAELIRLGGIDWKRAHDPDWRDKPWHDGVVVDLDESDVVEAIVSRILAHAAPDPARLTDDIEAILAEHADCTMGVAYWRDESIEFKCGVVACPPHGGLTAAHRAHVADVLSGLLAEARAEAWDEGMHCGSSRAMRHMSDEPGLPLASEVDNPYRARGTDTTTGTGS